MESTLENPPRPTRLPIVAFCAAAAAVSAIGCARTVLVPEAAPIRIGPTISGRVYTYADGEWTLSANRVTIPEGWYAVPPSFVEDADDARAE